MLENFKLRHLDVISMKEVDYSTLMTELLGYKPSRWNKAKAFVKSFNKVYGFVEEIKQLDITKITVNPDCNIKCPDNIDTISFSAMMSIQTLSTNPGEKKTGELMSELIAMACFKEYVKEDFDSESEDFKRFKKHIYESPAVDMIGLYHQIDQKLEQSNKLWEHLFTEVQVIDEDYMNADGGRMANFNVINTVKAICQDFNCTYEEAWQMPYGVTQTNSLSKATSGFVQHRMTQIKEGRMRFERQSK